MPTPQQRLDYAAVIRNAARLSGYPDTIFSDAFYESVVGVDMLEREITTVDNTDQVLVTFPLDKGQTKFVHLDVLARKTDGSNIFCQRDLKLKRLANGTVSSVFRTTIDDWGDGMSAGDVVIKLVDNAASVDVVVDGVAATTLSWKVRATNLVGV